MTTEQKFDCIFCKDAFDSKEELQIHFRKHADPKFKSSNRFLSDQKVTNEKVKETEMVSCDVCSKMFLTISKAITHKHKVHPDHDVKYFCPWCGKLFTMKHPYNIHVQTNHENPEPTTKTFHCDSCDVDFFLPSAVLYHNKFFHRQDTDIPDVGSSKKLRFYNQEVMNLYYCSFCGEEYENKVNLFKHITDDHSDENQSPEEVLRCPVCEALFYHLDAYEIHLTFHSTEDLYSVPNELFASLLDFSLETVPPMVEKVEDFAISSADLEVEAHSQDTDAESSANAMGIEKFLELAMGQADDSNPGKVKKKKHKKSKKSAAITLDEFLSMNQDVFGEGLDFQGVEEVPTRVVAKQFKNNRKTVNAATSAELQKLKEKGIMVMKVSGSMPKSIPQKIVNQPPKKEFKTSNDVLKKLLNQTNSQIKIVKKSIPSTAKDDTGQQNAAVEDDSKCEEGTNEVSQTKDESKEEDGNKNMDETEEISTKAEDTEVDNANVSSPNTNNDQPASPINNITADTISENTEVLNKEMCSGNNEEASLNNTDNSEEVTKVSTPDVSPKLEKNEERLCSNNADQEIQSEPEKSDSEMPDNDEKSEPVDINKNDSGKDLEEDSNAKSAEHCVNQTIDSISNLKHLSHLTVKPVNQNKNLLVTTDKISETKVVDKSLSNIKHLSHLTIKPISQSKDTPKEEEKAKDAITEPEIEEIHQEQNGTNSSQSAVIDTKLTNDSKPAIDKDPTLDALKTLNKNIIIKSLSSGKRSNDNSNSDDDHDAIDEPPKNPVDVKVKDISESKQVTIKKIKVETDDNISNNKVLTAVSNAVKYNQYSKIENTTANSSVKNTINILKHLPNITTKLNTASGLKVGKTNVTQNSPVKSKPDLLKHLPNIITKPINNFKKRLPPPIVKQSPIKPLIDADEIIEISDIDDSDDENDKNKNSETKEETKQPEPKQEATKSNDPLKNLGKHITIKSLNQPVSKNITVEKLEQCKEEPSDVFNSDDEAVTSTKVCSQKLSSRSMAFKNTLKNLNKDITVKSGTSSPSHSVTSQEHNSQDSHVDEDDAQADLDPGVGKVKITEIEDEQNSEKVADLEDDAGHSDNGPIIESPHDSESENGDEKDTDFESEIKSTTVQKTVEESTSSKNTICLNNLKNISKNLTIKSVNSNSSDYNEKLTNYNSQESLEGTNGPSNELAIKRPRQFIKGFPTDNTATGMNAKRTAKFINQSSNESMNQNVSINKEVTVKTFQTKTVIQEITTTVTKTIKTVNQTVKQEMRNSSRMNIPVLPQKVLGMKPSVSKNLQGVVIRHAAPVRPNNVVSQIRPIGTIIRPSRQIGPIRPNINVARMNSPRLPTIKNNLIKSSPSKPVIGKPLKISPSALTSATGKRPNAEETNGPFSCFKKPKESLIPVSDVPTFASGSDSTIQVKTASHTSNNYISTSKTIKGNCVVSATQMKSDVTSMQQLRVNNAVGTKVRNTQIKQSQVHETSVNNKTTSSESNSMKRTTLEAIEKLQKQGLLIKKPRIDVSENSDSDHDDNVVCSSTDEKEEHDE